MKIIFSPKYSETPYVNYAQNGNILFDSKFVNGSGLLNILELRAGLTHKKTSAAEREAQYLVAVKRHADDAFYKASFEKDDWGVARTLLRWRDMLVLAGWEKNKRGISTKLDKLADIESDFCSNSEADRWVAIANYPDLNTLLTENDSIEVTSNKALIDPIIQKVLDAFGDKVSYATIVTPQGQDGSNLRLIQNALLENIKLDITTKDDSFEIIEFDKQEDAYDWFVRTFEDNDNDNCVVVNSDTNTYNSIATRYAKPKVDASIENSNPQLLQLFKLGLSLFERPINAYNLLSYLQLPINPIPSTLRWKLAGNLIKEGGLNDDWYKTIEEFDFKNEKGKDIREEKLVFLQHIDSKYEKDIIPIDDIKQYNNALLQWCTKRMYADGATDNEREIFNALTSFCSALNIVVNTHDAETIGYDKLGKWIENIYRPISMKSNDAEKGSVNMISDISLVYNSPEHLVWLDCTAKNEPPYKYNFLTETEIKGLEKQGIVLPSATEMLVAIYENRNRAIAKVTNRITLIKSSTSFNKITRENSLITELNTPILTPKKGALELDVEEKSIDKLETQLYYEIEQKPIVIDRKESYSSINTLIQYPFDYVMKYAVEVYENKNNEFDDINTTRGNVAHHMVEKIFELAKNDTTEARKIIETRYDELFHSAVHSKGIILLSKENSLEYTLTKNKLKQSLLTLLAIIEENKLTPYDCEVEIECKLEGIGYFGAIIDMLLTNSNGDFVIFDFKWSNSNNYKTTLEENKEVQLALYERAVMTVFEKAVVAKGYYLFPKCKLYTCDELISNDNIIKVTKKETVDIVSQIGESYAYRKQELANGTIEEGECQALENLEYHNAENLFPLKPLESDKKKKSLPYTKRRSTKKFDNSSDNKSTTYTILKSKLK